MLGEGGERGGRGGKEGPWWVGLNLIRQSFPGLDSFSGSSWLQGGQPLARRQSGITVMGTHPQGSWSHVKKCGAGVGGGFRVEGVEERGWLKGLVGREEEEADEETLFPGFPGPAGLRAT